VEEELAASRRDDDDRAGGEGEINEMKEIRGARGDGRGGERTSSCASAADTLLSTGLCDADTYREMYISCFTPGSAFRSVKAMPAEYHRR
jgi:hypothetical protein